MSSGPDDNATPAGGADRVVAQFESDAAGVADLDALDELRAVYLGRKRGVVTALFQSLRQLEGDAKREAGAAANRARQQITARLEQIDGQLRSAATASREQAEVVDVTLPGFPDALGCLHCQVRAGVGDR